MIARLEGSLAEKTPGLVVLDVRGVGYEVRVPLSTFTELPDEGKTVRLRIHTHVREEALHLYGFLTQEERAAFGLLLSINGVGPRLALALISGLPVSRLAEAVRASDPGALRGIPGVGPKTAERILIELRGRIEAIETESVSAAPGSDETISALVNLGYPRNHAEKAVRGAQAKLGDDPPLSELVREALREATR